MFGITRRQNAQTEGRSDQNQSSSSRIAAAEREQQMRIERYRRFLDSRGCAVLLQRPAPNPEIRWID